MNNTSWLQQLSTVMYGLRVVPRADTGVSAAEMLYGTLMVVI